MFIFTYALFFLIFFFIGFFIGKKYTSLFSTPPNYLSQVDRDREYYSVEKNKENPPHTCPSSTQQSAKHIPENHPCSTLPFSIAEQYDKLFLVYGDIQALGWKSDERLDVVLVRDEQSYAPADGAFEHQLQEIVQRNQVYLRVLLR